MPTIQAWEGSKPETVRPIDNPNIIMQSEEYNRTYHTEWAMLNVSLSLINDSDKEITVLMGFPKETWKVNIRTIWKGFMTIGFTILLHGLMVKKLKCALKGSKSRRWWDGTKKRGMNMEDLYTIMKVYNGEGIPFGWTYITWGFGFPMRAPLGYLVTFKPGRKKIIKEYIWDKEHPPVPLALIRDIIFNYQCVLERQDREGRNNFFIMEDIAVYQVESTSPDKLYTRRNMITWQFEDFGADFI